ncbi:HD domain-containing protein [Gordonia sp. DT101]|uniref:HD domain-containing protein n=1 Tax=Gordonia sp. DT101 TaxID=3416545 RepID=UPI003CE9E401
MNDDELLEPELDQAQRHYLISRWSEPQRRYHTVEHLRRVLESLRELQDSSVEFDVVPVRLAAWFHDAVYDIPGHDNEIRSAELASTMLAGHGSAGEVTRLVRITATHHVTPGDRNAAALCDADLSILGAAPADYARYTQQVREEYASVPDEYFRPGRADVLRGLLNQQSIFHTGYGHKRWEERARRNVTDEIVELEPERRETFES